MSTFFREGGKNMITKANLEIRKAIREFGLTQWKVADLMGYSEATMLRKLRKELSQEEKAQILEIIKQNKED